MVDGKKDFLVDLLTQFQDDLKKKKIIL